MLGMSSFDTSELETSREQQGAAQARHATERDALEGRPCKETTRRLPWERLEIHLYFVDLYRISKSRRATLAVVGLRPAPRNAAAGDVRKGRCWLQARRGLHSDPKPLRLDESSTRARN
jgi:hypothetical protein